MSRLLEKIKKSNILLGFIPIAVFLVAWEVIARFNLFPGHFFIPSFTSVLSEFFRLLKNGVLMENYTKSLVRVLIGFIAGSTTGIFMGIIMGYNEKVSQAFHPILSLFYPIPALGWLPLFMLWFGINEILPIMLIFVCSFFPVLYNTITGIRSVDDSYIKAARTLGANDWKILKTVIIPMALPNIFTGLRLESGMAWRTIIAAEMVAIPTGIGALMMKAESLFRIDIIIVCLMVLALMCLGFERFFIYLEDKMTGKWRKYA